VVAERIGILGGTFDPPHIGHLVAAVNAAHQCALDEVRFVVANVPWQKAHSRTISPAHDRLAMVERAVATQSAFIADTIEIELGGDSITANTLEELQRRHPGTDFVVIIGSDAAAGLRTWRRADDLAAVATFAVVRRPGSADALPPPEFRHSVVPCPLMDVSSTEIRDRARSGLPLDYLVSKGVQDYIQTHQLYRRTRDVT